MTEVRSPSRGGTEHSSVFGVEQVGVRLHWKQPKRGVWRWELWNERECVAVLERHGLLTRTWTVAGPSGAWEMERTWRGPHRFRRPGAAAAIEYEPEWRGGRLRLPDATRLVWKRLRRGEWAIANEEGHPFMTLRARRGFLRLEGSVEFDVSARRLADIEPLLLLTWILMTQERRSHAH